MRKIDIITSKKEYLPGEEVQGKVTIECDSPFKCKKSEITFVGDLTAKGYSYKTGRHGTTTTQKKKETHS